MSFDVLHNDVLLNRNLFLEASAGTGKTFAIQHLYVRRLLEPSANGIYPTVDDIAVVTFTKVCAIELQERIRQTLLGAKQQLESLIFEWPYLQDIASKNAKLAKRKIAEALFKLDRAPITTIHSLCYRLYREFKSSESFIGVDPAWMSRTQERELLLEFLAQQSVANPSQVYAILRLFNFKETSLIEELLQRIWSDSIDVAAPSDFETIQEIIRSFAIDKDAVFELLVAASNSYKNIYNNQKCIKDEVKKEFEAFASLFDNGSINAYILSPLFISERFSPDEKKAKVTDDLPELLQDMQLRLEPLLKSITDPHMLFLRLASDARKFFQKRMEELQLLTPDMLLHQIDQLLDDSSFVQFIKERFTTIIVDEFQDTDPKQWKLVSKGFLENNWDGVVYLVGDPKQAIYGFRNADIYSYMKAKSVFGNESHERLNCNYRSSKELVDSLNFLFSHDGAKGLFDLPQSTIETIDAHPLIAVKDVANRDLAPIHCFVAKTDKGRARNWPTTDIEEMLFLPQITKEIAKAHAQGIPLNHIAVLVQTRYQASRVASFLRSASIPSYGIGFDTVSSSLAKDLLERVFDAIERPKDMKLLLRLLVHVPFGMNSDECKQFIESEEMLTSWGSFVHKLQLVKNSFSKLGISSAVHTFLEQVWVNEKSIHDLILEHEYGNQLLVDIEHIVDLALSQNITSISDVKKFLASLSQEYRYDEEKLAKRVDLSKPAVHIMTMHKSKGLEFDIVFALGAASRTTPSKRSSFDTVSTVEQDAEKLRQFYVACTRAKKRLYLFVAIDLSGKTPILGTAAPIELYLSHQFKNVSDTRYGSITAEVMSAAIEFLAQNDACFTQEIISIIGEDLPKIVIEEPAYKPAPIELETVSVQKQLFSSYSLLKMHDDENLKIHSSKQSVLPNGKEFGTFIHKLMQEILETKAIQKDSVILNAIIEKRLRYTPFAHCTAEIKKMIGRLLSARLPIDDDVTLADINLASSFVEHEFCYEIVDSMPQTFMRGTLDFVFEHNGVQYIVDWKTTDLESFDQESLAQVMKKEQYELQAEIYSKAWEQYTSKSTTRFGGVLYIFLRGFLSNDHILPIFKCTSALHEVIQ